MAVNQLEAADTIKQFLEVRQWQVDVALDADGAIGKMYQAASIPQLVVIDQAGVVRQVFVGNRGDLEEQLKQTLAKLLQAAL